MQLTDFMRLHVRVAVGALTVLALALAGCAAEAPSPTSSPSASNPAPDETPTPAPTRPTLEDVVVDPGGLGDIRIGRPVPQTAPELSLVEWHADACIESGMTSPQVGEPWAGRWEAVYSDPTTGWPYSIITAGGVQQGDVVHIFADSVPTATGIRVGSTRAELEAAYSSFSTIQTGDYVDLYAITEGGSRLVFEVVHEGSTWMPDDAGRVLIMYVEPSDGPLLEIAGSDSVSACPA